MTIPTAEQLEITFRQAGQIRLGKAECKNDSNYWVGGRCEWGGSHNLAEDCRSLVKGFGKIESLEKMSEDLRKCTSKSEFENQKNDYLRVCNELLSGLSNNNAHSCMFDICIIWSDNNMSGSVQIFVDQAKTGINNLKSALGNESYQTIEELNQINLEINQLEQKMDENKQKAINETDPIARSRLIALIEADGKVLQTKLNRRAQIENTLNFSANRYVNDLIDAMKRAIEGSNSGGGYGSGGGNGRGGGNRNPYRPTILGNPNNPNPRGPDVNFPGPDEIPDPNPNPTTPTQNNQQLLIFGAIALVAIYFLMNQKPTDHDY